MRRVGAAVLVVLLGAGVAGAAPSAAEILHRVLNANADTPDVTSADVLFKLRINKPLSQPPDCEFTGTMQVQSGRQSVKTGPRTSGVLCWAVDRYVLGRLFEASEPIQSFLDRFDFRLLGEKLVGSEHYYLMEGKARDPNNNPRSLVGWVDYERGLVMDGTIEYSWGVVETEQRYARVNEAWVVAHQVVHANRFDATLEITYSNFKFTRSTRTPPTSSGGTLPDRPGSRFPRRGSSPGTHPRDRSA